MERGEERERAKGGGAEFTLLPREIMVRMSRIVHKGVDIWKDGFFASHFVRRERHSSPMHSRFIRPPGKREQGCDKKKPPRVSQEKDHHATVFSSSVALADKRQMHFSCAALISSVRIRMLPNRARTHARGLRLVILPFGKDENRFVQERLPRQRGGGHYC